LFNCSFVHLLPVRFFISSFVIFSFFTCSFLHLLFVRFYISPFVFCSFVLLFSVHFFVCFLFSVAFILFSRFFCGGSLRACAFVHLLVSSEGHRSLFSLFLFSGSFNPSLGFPTSKGTDRNITPSLRELTAQKVSRSSLKKKFFFVVPHLATFIFYFL